MARAASTGGKDGLWAAQYLVDTPDGKTKRKYFYGKKRKDVAEKLAEALKERGRGCCSMPVVSPLPSFGGLDGLGEGIGAGVHAI